MVRRITDSLHIGDMYDAQEYGEEYEVVITMAPEVYDVTTEAFLIDDGEHDYELFEAAVDAIRTALANGKKTLVHCQAGMSRSVAVATTACVSELDMEWNEAYDMCRCGYNHIAPELEESAHRYLSEN